MMPIRTVSLHCIFIWWPNRRKRQHLLWTSSLAAQALLRAGHRCRVTRLRGGSWLLKLSGILAHFLPFNEPCVTFAFSGVTPGFQPAVLRSRDRDRDTSMFFALIKVNSYSLGAAFRPSHCAASCVVKGAPVLGVVSYKRSRDPRNFMSP